MEYYVNFLVNVDNTAGAGATLEIVDNNLSLAITVSSAQDSFSTSSGFGWQREIFKFIPVRDVSSASIKLSAGSADAFFDDISIEPVLKVADNTYVPKECRLYPKQDSLTCKSSQTNIISNGLYGYCLEHDPKNPEVCLMWHPIDNIKSSQASGGASTGFNGYTNSGANPSYCPAVSVDFDFVQYKGIIDAGNVQGDYKQNGCCSSGNHICMQLLDESSNGYRKWRVIFEEYKGNPHPNICHTRDVWIPNTTMGGIRVTSPYNSCINGGTPDPSPNGPIGTMTYANSGFWWSWFGVTPPTNPLIKVENQSLSVPLGNNYCTATISAQNLTGWYKYNATGSGAVKIWNYENAAGTELMEVSDYQPKCASDYLESSIAWVDRVKNVTTASPVSFITGAPYNLYNNTKNAGDYNPYGPKQFDYPGLALGKTKGGAPWGCINSNNRNYYYSGMTTVVNGLVYTQNSYKNLCMSIASDEMYSIFSATTSVPGIGLVSDAVLNDPAPSIGHGLKNLFLQFKYDDVTYDYSNFKTSPLSLGISTIPACNTSGVGPRNNSWCGIYPTIENKKLTDPSGNLMTESNGVYLIKTPGFYRLTFGATLDLEQFPIKKIVIDWGDDSDPMVINSETDPSQNFSFIRYYNPANQTSGDPVGIKIKVMDNWGFFKCIGLASNSSYCTNQCCASNFDKTDTVNFQFCLDHDCLNW